MDGRMGSSVRRKEDARLLTGQGRFSDDSSRPDQLHAVMVRSPYSHAKIRGVDKARAVAAPGVVDVLTGQDFLDDGLNRIPHVANHSSPPDIVLTNKDGSPVWEPEQFPLPVDKARYVGEAVAFVVAETKAQAQDGAEAVEVDYEPLPFVTNSVAALSPGAPCLWDEVPDNVSVDTVFGDVAATDAAFATAAHVAHMDTWTRECSSAVWPPEETPEVFRGSLPQPSGCSMRSAWT